MHSQGIPSFQEMVVVPYTKQDQIEELKLRINCQRYKLKRLENEYAQAKRDCSAAMQELEFLQDLV